MEGLSWLNDNYKKAMENMSDPRSSDYLLMSSPLPTCICGIIYLLIVWQGPKYMASREPFKLTSVLKLYNLTLVILSSYMFYEFFVTTVLNPNFSLSCQPMDYSDDRLALRLVNACWLFYFSKLIEFADTFFFILRKKTNQLSFLHVYHHFTMPLLWWVGVRFVPGGESYFSAMINSFIHILMYAYYGLAALGPSMQKYLWWKKYMTSLQLVQFWSIFFHTLYTLKLNCGFPIAYHYALLAYIMSHIILFSNFYIQSYMKKGKTVHQEKLLVQNGHAELYGDKKQE